MFLFLERSGRVPRSVDGGEEPRSADGGEEQVEVLDNVIDVCDYLRGAMLNSALLRL